MMTTISDDYYQLCADIDAALSSAADAQETHALTERAVAWCRRHLPDRDPELATALVRNAHAAFRTDGVSEKDGRIGWHFEICLAEAAEIRRENFGPHSGPVLATLDTLTQYLLTKREWQKAAASLREQILILRELRGPVHPDIAWAEQRLADALQWSGNQSEAEEHYRASLAVWQFSPMSLEAYAAWSGWGFLCESKGDLTAATAAFEEAVRILRAHHGEAAPGLAVCLTALGRVLMKRGELDEAVGLHRQALAIQRAFLGEGDPQVAATWESISLMTAASDRASSLDASRGALRADGHWLGSGAAANLDPAAVRGALSTLGAHAGHHLAVLLTGDPTADLIAEVVAVAAWRRRLPGLLVHFSWPASSGTEDDLAEQRRGLAAEQATLSQRWPSYPKDGEVWIGNALQARSVRDREAALNKVLRFRPIAPSEACPLSSPQLDTVRAALAPDECVVEFIRLAGHLGGRYHAIVVGPGDREAVAVNLGPAEAIDAAALLARIALAGGAGTDPFRNALPEGIGDVGADAPRALCRLVIGPLTPLFEGCRQLIFIPDGPLLHIPLGALPMDDSRPLLAEFSIRYMSGSDEVAHARLADASGARGPDVVIAAPDFDLGTPDASTRSGRLFNDLVGTWLEGEAVAEKLGDAVLLTRDQALKSRIRSVRSPRVLHIATHGYAFSMTDSATLDRLTAAVAQPDWRASARFGRLRSDLMLRSGLALAGANTWLWDGDPGPEAETGLLTAGDIAGLDLTGTDMAVLSACDTGLGDVDPAAGHASLSYAFLRAGARTVVASLWKVPDRATRRLMTKFYDHLADGRGKAEALRLAQFDMHRAGHTPAEWAAFVCFGDDGPLARLT
ncbi:CHAT domain-containing protein [Microbispora bryophytorum]|uniref:CHAT domain-containing protein n=1 Tax=Microbispora bryophytorum TaxID=1460882 RepID=UPI0033C4805E